MNRRNVLWLVAIVAVGVVLTIAFSWVWGLIGAGATLLVSEVAERTLRQRRRTATGASGPSTRDLINERRNRR